MLNNIKVSYMYLVSYMFPRANTSYSYRHYQKFSVWLMALSMLSVSCFCPLCTTVLEKDMKSFDVIVTHCIDNMIEIQKLSIIEIYDIECVSLLKATRSLELCLALEEIYRDLKYLVQKKKSLPLACLT